MKSFVSTYFENLGINTQQFSLSDAHKNQILTDIYKCNTFKDIILYRELIRFLRNKLSFGELIEIQIKINDREYQLEYILKYFHQSFYSYYEIRDMLKQTNSVLVCKALQLHIDINFQNYKNAYSDANINVLSKIIKERIHQLIKNYSV